MRNWTVLINVATFYYIPLISFEQIFAVCPNFEDIPPPICAFLFTDDECSNAFCTVREDSLETELDPLWNDQITLAIIRPDCFLDLYDGANITETHRFLGGETSEGNVYVLKWYAFANRATSYFCFCNGFLN
uniref:C2 domain-containing protein n=1 Tax=Setaria digitata TaxID=48799 RepID=A0A915PK75_9BILA